MMERELYEDELRGMIDELRKLPKTAERDQAFARARELQAQRNLGSLVTYLRVFLERMRYTDEVHAADKVNALVDELLKLPKTAERDKAFARAREMHAEQKLGDLARYLEAFLRDAAPVAQSPPREAAPVAQSPPREAAPVAQSPPRARRRFIITDA
jgi:hypothetical protein